MSPRVLIGGGTGFVGRNLTKLLKTKGYDVTVISRQAGEEKITWENIKSNGLPSGVESVVNLTGENVLNFAKRWTKKFKEDVYKSRVDSTTILSKAISASTQQPKSFITMSGVGIYPASSTNKYDENTIVKEFDFLSKLCHDWEGAAHLKKDDQCRVATIRSGVVLGRDGGMIKDLFLPFKLGLGGPIGSGNQYLPWIHIEDLTNLIFFCITKDITGILNGVAPESATNKQFTNAFAKSLSRPAVIPIPEFVFNILLGGERAKMITQGQCVIPKVTLEKGFQFKYPNIQSACDSFAK